MKRFCQTTVRGRLSNLSYQYYRNSNVSRIYLKKASHLNCIYSYSSTLHQATRALSTASTSPPPSDDTKYKPTIKSLKELLKLAKPQSKLLGISFGCLLVSSAVAMILPSGIGKIIDYIVHPENAMFTLPQVCLGLGGIFILGAIASITRIALVGIAGEKITIDLRKTLFSKLIHSDVSFFDTRHTGELMNRFSSDISIISRSITQDLSIGIRRIIEGIFGVALLVFLNYKLSFILLFMLPPLGLGLKHYSSVVKSLTVQVQDKLSHLNGFIEEKLIGIKLVKFFNTENKELKKFDERLSDIYKIAKKEAIWRGGFFGTIHIAFDIAALLVLYYGGGLVQSGELTIGELTSYLIYSIFVGISISGASTFYSELAKGAGASVRIFEILNTKSKEITHKGSETLENLKGEIEFKNVKFNYPTRNNEVIFNNLNMKIPQGSVVALVGESGSGKSTITSLLNKLYLLNEDGSEGEILVDGVNINKLDTHWLRKQMGVVSQDTMLFTGSIEENISYSGGKIIEIDENNEKMEGGWELENKELEKEKIIESAKMANAHGFIDEFTDGYNTQVGERGVTLSGGQRQRIAIARALFKDPKILILDEATSALDSKSEYLVQQALEKMINVDQQERKKTMIIIAHRLSTIREADFIGVIENGKIVEFGNHNDLTALDGKYKKLVSQQLINK